MKKIITIVSVIMMTGTAIAQWWPTGTLLNSGGNFLGTSAIYNAPINIFTNGINRAQFTTGNALTSLVGNSGDGLRIFPIPNQSGSLDLFTSGNNGQNETHIVFGASGQISGQRNRFEFLSKANQGFWFDLINSNQYYKFATNATVHAFVGNNRFWRIGDQGETSNINASRRLEVVQNDWQFRLSRTNGSYTDFQTNANGNLQILPQGGSVGINLNANPTANLDVNGNARIRNVQAATPNSILVGVNANGSSDVNVRRLDFNGNPNTFLSGNGTFQTINTTPIPADNGVSRFTLFDPNAPYQLGDVYSNFFVSNTPLTANRQVRLNGNNLIFSGSGNVGIGLSYPTLPTEVLDVNGNARFHNVPSQGGQSLILGLQNGANTNDVELSRLAFPNDNSQVLLGNGTWGAAPTSGVGNYCGATQNPLLANYEVPLNDNNYYFITKNTAPLLDKNRVGIGYDCSDNLLGKLSVLQRHYQSVAENTFGGHFSNIDIAAGTSGIGYDFTGVYGEAIGMQPDGIKAINNGGMFFANNASINYGVSSFATRDASSPNHIGHINIGGVFTGTNGKGQSIGIRSTGSNSDIRNYGVDGFASGTASSIEDIGGNFRAMAPSGLNIGVKGVGLGGDYAIGVYGYADQGTYNYAGYFAGDLVSNQPIIPSDIQFKENISSITSADSLLSLLNPVNYTYKTTGNATRLSFPSGTQIGLIAQEVEQVVPELVREVTHPSDYDSIGNVVNASFNYKTVNYEGIIPLLIASHKEQKSTIDSLFTVNDSLQTQITDLNDRLTQLENCLSGILPFLCQLSQQAIQQNETKTQEELRHFIDVKLNNGTTIVLNQNVPNPFAETTVITYTVPNTVKDAQIVFYDAAGNRIKNVAILERGNGQLNVYGSDLSSGAYTYSLIADGQVVATKRMVKQ